MARVEPIEGKEYLWFVPHETEAEQLARGEVPLEVQRAAKRSLLPTGAPTIRCIEDGPETATSAAKPINARGTSETGQLELTICDSTESADDWKDGR